jgi:TfoX/Sxy family transcriptional regulator of competence genes
MAYDEELANRVRSLVGGEAGLTEQRMFGGLAMLLHGNMAVAVRGHGGLLVRADPEQSQRWLSEPGVSFMEMRGRSMAGWVQVEASACEKAADLKRWVKRGVSYAQSLPPKEATKAATTAATKTGASKAAKAPAKAATATKAPAKKATKATKASPRRT